MIKDCTTIRGCVISLSKVPTTARKPYETKHCSPNWRQYGKIECSVEYQRHSCPASDRNQKTEINVARNKHRRFGRNFGWCLLNHSQRIHAENLPPTYKLCFRPLKSSGFRKNIFASTPLLYRDTRKDHGWTESFFKYLLSCRAFCFIPAGRTT